MERLLKEIQYHVALHTEQQIIKYWQLASGDSCACSLVEEVEDIFRGSITRRVKEPQMKIL